jgi:uncharacterized membrane protein
MDLLVVLGVVAALTAFIAIPGLMLTFALFPKKDDITGIERAGLSTVLGLTPVVIQYALDKNFSVPITTMTTVGVFLVVSFAGLAVWQLRKK